MTKSNVFGPVKKKILTSQPDVKSTKFAAESTIFTDTVTTESFENAEFWECASGFHPTTRPGPPQTEPSQQVDWGMRTQASFDRVYVSFDQL